MVEIINRKSAGVAQGDTGRRVEWTLASLGNARGWADYPDMHVDLKPGASSGFAQTAPNAFTLHAEDGKFADSEDSFLFCCFEINPEAENFALSATLRAIETESSIDQQSGFGLMAVDSCASGDAWCRHRNHLLVGCFGREHVFGMRLVAGHENASAKEQAGNRIVDESRTFNPRIQEDFVGNAHRLSLEKTDEGFVATCDDRVLAVPGCDFLIKQDEHAIYVGFAVARGVELTVSDVSLEIKPGKASHTPTDAIQHRVVDYPFPRELLTAQTNSRNGVARKKTIYVAPHGAENASGDRTLPLSLEYALAIAQPGTHIMMLDGTYAPTTPLVVAANASGTLDQPIVLEAEHPRSAIVDGLSLEGRNPLFVLDADFWHLNGIVFRNSPLSGLTICGNVNRIGNCEAYANGDTGILIISRPGAERGEWPQRNIVSDCDSHDNCDAYRSNADGFGAKLRVGKANVFYRCIAHHNIDDGFDLYSKALYGPTEPVELDSCVAYENGHLANNGLHRKKKGGVGFKLGGENQAVAHEVWNCVAFGNDEAGFSSNSNPACTLHFCTSTGNSDLPDSAFVFFTANEPQWIREQLLQLDYCASHEANRLESGDIALSASLLPKTKGGNRIGASIGVRKNVLILVDSLSGGGAERVACKLATELSSRHAVYLMYLHDKDEENYLVGPDVTCIDATLPPAKQPSTKAGQFIHGQKTRKKWRAKLRKARKEHDIDTTVSLLSTPNLINASCKGGRRIICERNDPSQKPRRYRLKLCISSNRADYVIFQTRKVQAMLPKKVREKSCIIPNPVSVTCQAEPSGKRRIVTAGRLHPQKNYSMLLHAFALFSKNRPDFTLHLYGQGPLLDELQSLAETLGIGHAVRFEGFSSDVHAAISDAQMFVLSSDFEGMSNALIEAMMMGLPCISTDCTGSDELITDGVDGLLVPKSDAQAMCAAMNRLANNDTLRGEMGYKARLRALDFCIEDVVRKWERVL